MGTSKPHIKLKSDNNTNDTHMTPKENEQPEINEKTESANSSLKKMEENATENNNAAKQEEIKQTDTVEQPKEQRKLSDHLETISKIIGISTVLGILFGGFVIYVYLLKINQLSILPDVISNPSSLIAAITIFIIIFIIIFLLYYLSVYLFLPDLVLLTQDIIQDIRSSKSPKSNLFDKIVGWVFIIIIYLAIIIMLLLFLGIFLEYLFPQAKNRPLAKVS